MLKVERIYKKNNEQYYLNENSIVIKKELLFNDEKILKELDKISNKIVRVLKKSNFSEGLACIYYRDKDGKPAYLYINTEEKVQFTLPSNIIYASDFHNCLACVRYQDRTYAYIDKFGKVKYELPKDVIYVDDFRECYVKIQFKDKTWGFIDLDGNIKKLPKAIKNVGEFHENLAVIRSRFGECGYIDKNFNINKAPFYIVDIGDFSEDLAVTKHKDKSISYINKNLKESIRLPKSVVYAGDFHEGYARIQFKSGRCGLVDKNGKIVKLKKFIKYIGEFHDGYAIVNYQDGTFGYMDKEGTIKKMIKEVKTISNFNNGLAHVSYELKDGTIRHAYMDKQFKTHLTLSKDVIDASDNFVDGLVRVTYKNYNEGYVNKEGIETGKDNHMDISLNVDKKKELKIIKQLLCLSNTFNYVYNIGDKKVESLDSLIDIYYRVSDGSESIELSHDDAKKYIKMLKNKCR